MENHASPDNQLSKHDDCKSGDSVLFACLSTRAIHLDVHTLLLMLVVTSAARTVVAKVGSQYRALRSAKCGTSYQCLVNGSTWSCMSWKVLG